MTFQNVNVRVLVDLALKDLTVVIARQVWNRQGFTDSRLAFPASVSGVNWRAGDNEEKIYCFLLPLFGCVLGSKV